MRRGVGAGGVVRAVMTVCLALGLAATVARAESVAPMPVPAPRAAVPGDAPAGAAGSAPQTDPQAAPQVEPQAAPQAEPQADAQADAPVGPVTKLPLPRYVSLRSSRINVRRGPGQVYRIDWVFRRAGLPVRIVDEYGDWRRIVDADDAGGWVYHSLLSGRRTVLITSPMAELRDEPAATAPVAARAEQGVVARLIDCEPDWCEIEAGDVSGWVRKDALWGVEPGETLPD
ncbi:MAG: SH3 domain-containing protein [Thermohalobaculum sp.]|nr:SH3 domain-containing protein [Thermohalobaculum sp.]